MSEPTKEEALKYLRRWNVAWMLFVDHATPEETAKSEAVFHCLLDLVIKDWGMIEHGPEVSRNDIEAILENEKTTNAENMDALMDYLEAKGIKIEVEEIADEEEPKQYRCEGCGRLFETKIFSHSRAEMGKDGNPIEVECGPIIEED